MDAQLHTNAIVTNTAQLMEIAGQEVTHHHQQLQRQLVKQPQRKKQQQKKPANHVCHAQLDIYLELVVHAVLKKNQCNVIDRKVKEKYEKNIRFNYNIIIMWLCKRK